MALFIINCNTSKIEQSYTSNPIILDRNTDHEIALTECTLLYSLYNIGHQFKNNKFEWEKIIMNGLKLLIPVG